MIGGYSHSGRGTGCSPVGKSECPRITGSFHVAICFSCFIGKLLFNYMYPF
jgi:hypothetical protein